MKDKAPQFPLKTIRPLDEDADLHNMKIDSSMAQLLQIQSQRTGSAGAGTLFGTM